MYVFIFGTVLVSYRITRAFLSDLQVTSKLDKFPSNTECVRFVNKPDQLKTDGLEKLLSMSSQIPHALQWAMPRIF
jgi:hypothetical protein